MSGEQEYINFKMKDETYFSEKNELQYSINAILLAIIFGVITLKYSKRWIRRIYRISSRYFARRNYVAGARNDTQV